MEEKRFREKGASFPDKIGHVQIQGSFMPGLYSLQ
jgi:hypothetical protein